MDEQGFDHQGRIEEMLVQLSASAASAPTTRLAPVTPAADALLIHLDTKDWVDLSKYRVGRSDGRRFKEAYDVLSLGVAEGWLRVVLSAPLYLEMALQISDLERRNRLADVMSELSRFQTLNARHVLLKAEIVRALKKRFGRPAFPEKVETVGKGVYFAFSGKSVGLRLDDGGSGTTAQLLAKDPVNLLYAMYYMGELMEWSLLRGEGGVASIGDSHANIRSMDAERLEQDREFAALLKMDVKLKQKLGDVVLLRELYAELGTEFVKLLDSSGISVESFAWRGTEWALDFLRDLPIIRVQSTLRQKNHANASRSWKVNDLRDFEQLSLAVPYCDIVVTEKHSASILLNEKIDTEFGVAILKSVTELPGEIRKRRAERYGQGETTS